jgi:hypothetical protein
VPKGVTYKTTPQQRKAMLTTLVRDLGLTHMRIWAFPTGIEVVNDNNDPATMAWDAFTWAGQSELPQGATHKDNRQNGIVEWAEFLREATSHGLRDWIITPGRLPDWLKTKFNENAPDRFDEYAEWAAAHVLYLKKTYGLEAPFWSIYNEGDNANWGNADLWHAWVRATGARFRREGLATRLMVPDFMNAYTAEEVSRQLLASEETRSYIGALAYHHYRTSGDGPRPFLDTAFLPWGDPNLENIVGPPRRIAELARAHGLVSWETETGYYIHHYKDMPEAEIARARANEIYLELHAGASAVHAMFALWPDAVDPRYGMSSRSEGHAIVLQTDGQRVKKWSVTKDCGAILGHYGRFVRPGDRRIGANSSDVGVRVTAFVGETRQLRVAVLINNHAESRVVECDPGPGDWMPGFTGALLTDLNHTLSPLKVKRAKSNQGPYRLKMPGQSVVTVVWAAAPIAQLGLPEDVDTR